MNLVLDVGNAQIHGGLFQGERLINDFRCSTSAEATGDEIGLFLLQVLRELGCKRESLKSVGVASVVPSFTGSLENGIKKYLKRDPFILKAGKKTGLKIKTRSPEEVGADRIASCVGALALYPGGNLIIVDLGTATTFECVSSDRTFLGGVIAPGLRLSMEALARRTAQLPAVNIEYPGHALGKDTISNIQIGLYYGHVGMIRELIPRLSREAFGEDADFRIVGTGGYVTVFNEEKIFDSIEPSLVLHGVRVAAEMNPV